MAVLIDPPAWPAHGKLWSHLVSDASLDELHAFAVRLGVGRRGFDLDHYDVPAERYDDAVSAGAWPVEGRELVRRLAASGLRVRGRERVAAEAAVLLRRWDDLLPGATDIGEELLRRWREPHRVYHGIGHLTHTLDSMDLLDGVVVARGAAGGGLGAGSPRLTRLALWFHDAVHDGVARRDEEASAELAVSRLADRLPAPDVDEVARLVLVTVDHFPGPRDGAGALVSDADLAILGSSPDRYGRYAREVRAEHADVPDEAFRVGRAAVLDQLLSLDGLYATPTARDRWSRQAEANLRTELEALRRGVLPQPPLPPRLPGPP